MSKFSKGLVKLTIASATFAGLCYLFKDQIKESKVYKENDIDSKIRTAKEKVKEKISWGSQEEELIEDDEIILDSIMTSSSTRDYVTIKTSSSSLDDSKEETETV